MRTLRLLKILIVIFTVHPAFAQETGVLIPQSVTSGSPFSVHQYYRNKGLSGNSTLDILYESDGHILFAMEYGIYMFDGYHFQLLPLKVQGSPVDKLYHSDKHNVTFGRTSNYDLYEITHEARYLGTSSALCTRGDELLTISTVGVITRYLHPYFTPLNSIGTGIRNCEQLCYNGSTIIISDPDRVYEFSGDAKKLLKTYKLTGIKQITEDPYDHSFLLVGSNELYRIRDGQISLLYSGKSPAGFTKMVVAGRDSFYLTSYTGLYSIFPGESVCYGEDDGLPSHSMNGLAYDSVSDRLWIATGNKGVLRLEPKCARTYYRAGVIGDRSLGSVVRLGAEKLAIVENDRILMMNTRTDSIQCILEHRFPEGTFISLAVFGDTLATGTWGGGIFFMKDGKKIGRLLPPELPGKIVPGCFRDRRGSYWIATNNGIAHGKTLGQVRPLYPDKIQKLFLSFYQLRNGDVCAAGESGVYIFSEAGEIKRSLNSADGLVGKEVRAFYEDQEGLLWIGASAGGLYCYEKGVLTSINRKKQCALPPDIFTLAKAGDGRLYITTNNGLWAVDETKLRDFYRNKLNQLVPFHYDEAHGILNTEFNGGFQNNYAIGNDGRLFFPTVQGLVTFTPPATVETPFSAYIDHVLIDGISSDTLPGILDMSKKNIEIIATSINQESSRNSYLQYKLEREGVASVWSALSKETKFGLLLSAPGDYSLYLRVVDACNPEFSPVRVYSFTIKPHIYENKWFQITGIIIGLVLSAIIIRLIVTNREKEREKAFQIKTTILTLEMQALQSRMNPHFVFNILNNLKSLVSLGRTDKAEKIISNFSVLVRKAFEKSSETALPLGEEIGLVELYLKLQQERFDNSFTFHIRCPEILKNKQVPSFILQPLVENSVIHGIAHSEKECHIEVECTGEEGKLIIVVRDNGIGRTQSGKINRNKPNHQSKGLELIEKKIQIAREIYDMNISLSFEDADPVSGEGTIATLKISYHA